MAEFRTIAPADNSQSAWPDPTRPPTFFPSGRPISTGSSGRTMAAERTSDVGTRRRRRVHGPVSQNACTECRKARSKVGLHPALLPLLSTRPDYFLFSVTATSQGSAPGAFSVNSSVSISLIPRFRRMTSSMTWISSEKELGLWRKRTAACQSS